MTSLILVSGSQSAKTEYLDLQLLVQQIFDYSTVIIVILNP